MDSCRECSKWTTAIATDYGDGSRVWNWRASDGMGKCAVLGIETDSDFGCNKFEAGAEHVVRSWKNGAPWQHHKVGPCPDCRGRGSDGGVCNRCAGTGKVRYYDDGHIGEEQTRLHPREKETAEPLKCGKCQQVIDIKWIACPMCGNRLEPVAETEYIDGMGNGRGEFRNDREAARARLGLEIEEANDRDAKIAAMRRMTVENGCTEEEAATASAMADRIEAIGMQQ